MLRHFPALPGQAPVKSLFWKWDASGKLIECIFVGWHERC